MTDKKLLQKTHEAFEWDKWICEIPFIKMESNWVMRPLPPFGVGVARFNVKHKDYENVYCSIYLDCYDIFGWMEQPYWELYPYNNGNSFRCLINETDKLHAAIVETFAQQLKEKTND